MSPEEIALSLVAETDPIERFIVSIKDDALRGQCRDTVRLERELRVHLTAAHAETDLHAAMAHARWVRVHVEDVIYRRRVLLAAATRWATLEARPMTFNVYSDRAGLERGVEALLTEHERSVSKAVRP